MYLRVKIVTHSKKEKIIEIKDTLFEIHLKEKAEKNSANKRMCEIIAQKFNTEVKNIKIISGHRRPNKMINIIKTSK